MSAAVCMSGGCGHTLLHISHRLAEQDQSFLLMGNLKKIVSNSLVIKVQQEEDEHRRVYAIYSACTYKKGRVSLKK